MIKFGRLLTPTTLGLVVVGAALGWGTTGSAQTLTIGTRSEMTLDPHFLWSTPNRAYNVQLYGSLVRLDDRLRPLPMLATGWKLVNETTWEFKLNSNARFHNGKPVEADDVVASFERAQNLPNAAASYRGALSEIMSVQRIDAHTVRFVTAKPDPALLHRVAQIAIIPREIARTASQADFIAGRAAVGAGPYRYVSFQAGDRLVLARNDQYFGDRPQWEKVVFRTITDDAARVAALLGRDVDLIDLVPPRDIPRLTSDPGIVVHTGTSDRTMYLVPDTGRSRSPFVRDVDGRPLEHNPMQDVRVRRAMSLAIDRKVLVDRVMDGAGEPANQTVAVGVLGYAKDLPASKFDLERAKRLLADAGYPKGFGLTIHCTNDRYINDARLCQALGQMLSRLGLQMEVQTLPEGRPLSPHHPPRRRGHEPHAARLREWNDRRRRRDSEQHDSQLRSGEGPGGVERGALLESPDRPADRRGRHHARRDPAGNAQANAIALAMQDVAVIPLFHSQVIFALRKGIRYRIYADESTLADAASR